MAVPSIVEEHFAARAERYDRSSRWVTDPDLMRKVVAALAPGHDASALDVACGTGLVARALRPHVGRIVGVDISTEMAERGRQHLDELVFAPAEALPFAEASFDVVVCRQGIQFMDAQRAATEMVRVVRPGGKVCLVNLCAYGPSDRDEYFEVLRLRNAARRNFFLRGDLERLLRQAGCRAVAVDEHVSPEDVDVWSDHGAIAEGDREAIRAIYRHGSPDFLRLHAVESSGGRLVDHMLFEIAVGTK